MIKLVANGSSGGSSILKYEATVALSGLPRNYSSENKIVNHNLGVVPNFVQVTYPDGSYVAPLADDFWGGDGGCLGYTAGPFTTTQASFVMWYMSGWTSCKIILAVI